jgi:hypothetical protein
MAAAAILLGLGAAGFEVAGAALAALFLLSFAEFYFDGRPSTAGHFWEELVETNGYFLFAIAAWRHACLIGDPVLDAPL